MKSLLMLIGMAVLLGTVVGCEEEEHEHHRHSGGAYYGPEDGYYNHGEYHGYPDYSQPYYRR